MFVLQLLLIFVSYFTVSSSLNFSIQRPLNFVLTRKLTHVGTLVALTPSVVCAADSGNGLNLVAFPVVIAVLTMVPFIYYTQ